MKTDIIRTLAGLAVMLSCLPFNASPENSAGRSTVASSSVSSTQGVGRFNPADRSTLVQPLRQPGPPVGEGPPDCRPQPGAIPDPAAASAEGSSKPKSWMESLSGR